VIAPPKNSYFQKEQLPLPAGQSLYCSSLFSNERLSDRSFWSLFSKERLSDRSF